MKDNFSIIEFGPSCHARFNRPETVRTDKEQMMEDERVLLTTTIPGEIPAGYKNSILAEPVDDVYTYRRNPHKVDAFLLEKDFVMCGACASPKKDELYEKSEAYEEQKLIASGESPEIAKEKSHKKIKQERSVNNRYEKQDKEGKEGKGPSFILTEDGDVKFPEFGEKTLGEMYQVQQDVYPDQYNPIEHKTVMDAYDTLRSGSRQAAHVVHHYNEKGMLEIRDVVILTYDPVINKGEMHIINIAENGKNHSSVDSAMHAMEKRLTGFSYEEKSDGVFLFIRHDKPIKPATFFKQKEFRLPAYASESIDKSDVVGLLNVQNLYREPHQNHFESMTKDNMNDKKQQPIPFMMPEFLQRLVQNTGMEVLETTQHYRMEKISGKKQKKSKEYGEIKHAVIQIIQKEFQSTYAALYVIAETGLGALAPVFFSRKINEMPFMPFTKRERILTQKEYKYKRNEYVQKEKKRLLYEKDFSPPRLSKEKKSFFPSVKIYEGSVYNKNYAKNFIQEQLHVLYTMMQIHEKNIQQDKKKKKRIKRIIRLFSLYKNFLVLLENHEYKRMTSNNQDFYQNKNYDPAVLRFIQSFFLCIVFNTEIVQMSKIRGKENQKKEKTEYKQERYKKSPWILLSIIWYLTMIREQGVVQYQPKKKKKKAGKTHVRTGVIFDRSLYHPAAPSVSLVL